MKTRISLAAGLALASSFVLVSCNGPKGPTPPPKITGPEFIAGVNKDLVELSKEGNAAGWTQSTYITADTQFLNSKATERFLEYFSRKAGRAKAYEGQEARSCDRPLDQADQARRECAGAGRCRQARGARGARHRARGDVRRGQILPAGSRPEERRRLQEPR